MQIVPTISQQPQPMTVDFVMATQILTTELQQIMAEERNYRSRVDAIAAAVRRAPGADTGITALIIALASMPDTPRT